MKKISTLLAVFLLCTITRINSQCLTGNDSPQMMNPDSKKMLISAKFNFTLEAFKKSAEIEFEDNIFFSPHSLHEALTLAFMGARGNTESSLRHVLRIPDELSKIDLQRSYSIDKALRSQIESGNVSSSYEYKTANRLYVSSAKKVRECMLDLFGQELEKTDFKADPNAARLRINEWVSNTTKGNIKDLIPEDNLDETTDLVLVNAVYFKGLWQNKFDPANSERALFYGSKNSVVTYMRQNGTFNYAVSDELGAHVLQLPYIGDDISMFIFLPPFAMARSLRRSRTPLDYTGLSKLIERMTSSEQGMQELQDILNDGMSQRDVQVTIPRFTIEKELPVVHLLEELGAGDLFSANKADLRGFVEDQEGLHLNDAVHRAKIELNEEGTTAAAATALFSFRSSRPAEPAIFKANHPFVYLIYDRQSESIIFSGIYRTPVTPTEA